MSNITKLVSTTQVTKSRVITAEYERALGVRDNIDSIFFSNLHSDDREWLVLGAASQLLQMASVQVPYLAAKSESPDFQLFDQCGRNIGGIEIAEVLRPNYARHRWFKDAEKCEAEATYKVDPPIKEPWTTIRSLIQKKAAKKYPTNTALLLYFNIWAFSFPSPMKPVYQRLLDEHFRAPFEGCDQFSEVLVLDSGMESLVRLHPDPALIFSSRTDR